MIEESSARSAEHPAVDNRAGLVESAARDAEARLDALLANLPFGDNTFSSGEITATWQDDDIEDEPPFVAPQAVARITLKRIDGTRAEVDRFKRGYRIGSWADADSTLHEWASTVPDGSTQRVAYVVELEDGARLYGTFSMSGDAGSLRAWVIKENDVDPASLKAT